MSKAVLLIGVAAVPPLPTLQAVHRGVASFRDWAKKQGLRDDRVLCINDEAEKVTIEQICNAIRDLLRNGTLEQLLVYFSGHGIRIGVHEYWLLSSATTDSNAAVHVTESEIRARYCGVPHIVFFADCCRTAAGHSDFQYLNGCSIFPNPLPNAKENFVDLLNATSFGDTSADISIDDGTERKYVSIYTEELVKALSGDYMHLCEPSVSGDMVLKLRVLNKFLCDEVPRRVEQIRDRIPATYFQNPFGRISSEGTVIAHFKSGYPVATEPACSLRGDFPFDAGSLSEGNSPAEGAAT